MTAKIVEGVSVRDVKYDLLKVALAKVNIQPGAHINEDIKLMTAYFKTKKPESLVKCDKCSGISTIDFDECPFCGMTDGPTKPTAEPEKVEPPVQKESPAKTKKKTSAPVKPETAMVPVSAVGNDIVLQGTEEDLDLSVAAIHNAKNEAARSYWAIGKLIGENHARALWKARKDADGKVRYTSFNVFCEAEIGIGQTHAYNLMDIARAFSEEHVKTFGTSKLGLVLQVPKEDQAHLMEVAGSASKRELEKAVKDVKTKNAAAGKAKPDKGRKDTSKASAASKVAHSANAPPTGKKDVITIASIEGTKTIKLFATPAKRGDASKEAKSLKDEPWGRVELENNTEMVFKVKTNAAGHLILQMVTRRMKTE